MRPIQFCLQLFGRFPGEEAKSEDDRHRSEKVLLFLLEALVTADLIWLQAHPDTPSIYVGVAEGKPELRYRREVDNEVWSDTPTIFKCGYADCEDLGSARVAELRKVAQDSRALHGQGHDCDDCNLWAAPWISWRRMPNGGYLYHCRTWRSHVNNNLPPIKTTTNNKPVLVKCSDQPGYIEDPSLVLGMGWVPESPASIQEMPFDGNSRGVTNAMLSGAAARGKALLSLLASRGRGMAAQPNAPTTVNGSARNAPKKQYWRALPPGYRK